MINPQIRDQAYQFFIEEANDLLNIIETGLLTLKDEKTRGKVHEIMRAAHSIKGGAATVGLMPIQHIAHRLEDYFKLLYQDTVEIDSNLESLLLSCFDCLRYPLVEQITTGTFNEEKALEDAENLFSALDAQFGELITGEVPEYLPSSEDLGIDITTTLFETDVSQELEHLAEILATKDPQKIQEQLVITGEIFAGFAEMLNLPNFAAIATATQKALKVSTDDILTLGQIVHTEFSRAQQQILSNPDHHCSGPSEQLLAYSTPSVGANPSCLPDVEDDIKIHAYQYFKEEAPELLGIIENGLVTLQTEKTHPLVYEVMRATHSLKGGAASAGLETLRAIAYRIEKLFRALQHDDITIDGELWDLLWLAYESLNNPLREIFATGTYDEDQANQNADPVLRELEFRLKEALERPEKSPPSSQELGIDITSSIFDVDVGQELERLAQVLADPSNNEVHGEIRATAEVFAGFAEMLNLPGFGEIATLTLKALELNPDQIIPITTIALENFTAARQQVLAGDRSCGGQPSPQLLALAGEGETPNKSRLEGNVDEEEESLSEVFGEIQVSTDDYNIFPNSPEEIDINDILSPQEPPVQALLDGEMGENIPSLEDIFGTPEPSVINPSLEDIFVQTEPSSSILSSPQLEDIFTQTEFPSETLVSPSLEDIFTQTEFSSETLVVGEDIFAQSEAPSGTVISPSLEDVFGPVSTEAVNSPISEIWTENSHQEENPVLAAGKDETNEQNGIKKNIEKIIDQVTENIEKFPVLKEITNPENPLNINQHPTQREIPKNPTLASTQIPESKKTQQKSITPEISSNASLSVRVDFNRLERMNNLVGELAINRNSLSLQNDQIQNSVKELLNRFSRFRNLTDKIRELSDHILVDTSLDQRKIKESEIPIKALPIDTIENSTSQNTPYFDQLEMDRYGRLYSLLQGILEDMLQLEESVDDIVLFARGSNQTLEQQRQMLTSLRDELMWARMLPLGEVLNRFPRLLRDLSNTYSKPVRLKLLGTGVLVDRVALEKLYDPLVHLLRNAFDHGIEPPEVRRSQGKPVEGQIEVRAYHQGNQTIIEIKDDGGGLNLDKIRLTAQNSEIATPEQLAVMSNDNLYNLIFEPGFSTADKVSELSGRGVGLDIVRSQIRAIKGSVSVQSTPQQGTVFTLRLPLTLTIAKLLVCLINPKGEESGTTALALPSDSIAEIVIPQPDQIKKSGEKRFLYWQQEIIPIYSVSELLDYHCTIPKSFSSKVLNAVPMPADWGLPLLILRQGQQLQALEVDRLVTEQELVIKPFGTCVAPPPYTYGCTILGDGTLIPVINGAILIEQSQDTRTPLVSASPESSTPQISAIPVTLNQTPTVLVVDDSAALRRTLALTLQKIGYRVLQARDGREALEQLQQNTQIKLVICDVEMPNMNGFEFLGQRRRDPQLMKIPVAMLTSRSSDKHRQLATHLGASAYFTKPYIEQQFLTAIKNIMGNQSPVTSHQ